MYFVTSYGSIRKLVYVNIMHHLIFSDVVFLSHFLLTVSVTSKPTNTHSIGASNGNQLMFTF